jgi:hypothetical protein
VQLLEIDSYFETSEEIKKLSNQELFDLDIEENIANEDEE